MRSSSLTSEAVFGIAHTSSVDLAVKCRNGNSRKDVILFLTIFLKSLHHWSYLLWFVHWYIAKRAISSVPMNVRRTPTCAFSSFLSTSVAVAKFTHACRNVVQSSVPFCVMYCLRCWGWQSIHVRVSIKFQLSASLLTPCHVHKSSVWTKNRHQEPYEQKTWHTPVVHTHLNWSTWQQPICTWIMIHLTQDTHYKLQVRSVCSIFEPEFFELLWKRFTCWESVCISLVYQNVPFHMHDEHY